MVDRNRSDTKLGHQPVLLAEVIRYLDVQPGETVIDGTVGLGGHSQAILRELGKSGTLLAIDQDEQALAQAQRNLAEWPDQVILVKANFDEMESVARLHGIIPTKILLDLGVSSLQLDDSARGFSFSQEAALDMRMDKSQALTASQVLANFPEPALKSIFQRYGEESFARLVAQRLVSSRDKHPIVATTQLARLVESALPSAEVRKRYAKHQHPATKVFQALRIAVNDELGALERVLPQMSNLLGELGGRCVIISFHSLEDRMVKQFFAKLCQGCVCPPALPLCACGQKPLARLVTKRVVAPSEHEVKSNPRARSAKLRVIEVLKP